MSPSGGRHATALQRAHALVAHAALGATDAHNPPSSVRLLLHPPVAPALPRRGERCLHIAPGSSAHATAVLSLLAGAAGGVTVVELDAVKAGRIIAAMQGFQSHLVARSRGPGGASSGRRAGGGSHGRGSEDVCASAQVLCGNALLPHVTDGQGPFDCILVGADTRADQLPALLPLVALGGRLVAVVDGALLLFTRRSNPTAPGSNFDRAVLDRCFTLGSPLQHYTRTELRSSIAALQTRAFAGGYGSGSAIAREAERQHAQELQAQLAAAQQQVRQLERLVASVSLSDGDAISPAGTDKRTRNSSKPKPLSIAALSGTAVGPTGGGGAPGVLAAGGSRADEQQQDDQDVSMRGGDGGDSSDASGRGGGTAGRRRGLEEAEEEEEEEDALPLQSPAKRTRLSPEALGQGDPSAHSSGGALWRRGKALIERSVAHLQDGSGGGGGDGAAAVQPLPPHVTPLKRRFAAGLANFFSGGCSTVHPLTPSPGVSDGSPQDRGAAAAGRRLKPLQAGSRGPSPLPAAPHGPSPAATEEGAAAVGGGWLIAVGRGGRSRSGTPSAVTAAALDAAEQSQGAAALGLPAAAVRAAVAPGASSDGGLCLPVAGLPLLRGASLASILLSGCADSSSSSSSSSSSRGSSNNTVLCCITSALGGTRVRLWCQAMPAATRYTDLGPVCSGLLQRHPGVTALLGAAFVQPAVQLADDASPDAWRSPESSPAAGEAAGSPAGSGGNGPFILLLEEAFGEESLLDRLARADAPMGWPEALAIASHVASTLVCLSAAAAYSQSWDAAAAAATAAGQPAAGGSRGRAGSGAGEAAAAGQIEGDDAASLFFTPLSSPLPGAAPQVALVDTLESPAAAEGVSESPDKGQNGSGDGSDGGCSCAEGDAAHSASPCAMPAAAAAAERPGTVLFCPVLRAEDVWLPSRGRPLADCGAAAAAKASLARLLLAQLLPPGIGETHAAAILVEAAAQPAQQAAAAQAQLRLASDGCQALGVLLLQLLTERPAAAEAVHAARQMPGLRETAAVAAAETTSSGGRGEMARQLAGLGFGLLEGAVTELEPAVVPVLQQLLLLQQSGPSAAADGGSGGDTSGTGAVASPAAASPSKAVSSSGEDAADAEKMQLDKPQTEMAPVPAVRISSAADRDKDPRPLQAAPLLQGVEAEWLRATFPARRGRLLRDLSRLTRDRPSFKVRVTRADVVGGFLDALSKCGGRGGGAATVLYQPLACSFEAEQGQDAGGVARDLLSTLAQQLCAPAAGLFRPVGPGGRQLYPVPGACPPAATRRYRLLGQTMAKALIESARSEALSANSESSSPPRPSRRGALGAVALHLPFPRPFWRVLLGEPVIWSDLEALDEDEARSLQALMGMSLEDGMLYETFELSVAPPAAAARALSPIFGTRTGSSGGAGGGGKAVAASGVVRLVPAGPHKKLTEATKREYVLRRARCLLVDGVSAQMGAVADGFWGLIPRGMVDRHRIGSEDLERLICGDANGLDVDAWRAAARVDGSSPGDAELVTWFWEAVEAMAPEQQRLLLQFWSGSDSVPLEGLASLDPPFHLRLVDPCPGGNPQGPSSGAAGDAAASPRRRRWPWPGGGRWGSGGGGANSGGGGGSDGGSLSGSPRSWMGGAGGSGVFGRAVDSDGGGSGTDSPMANGGGTKAAAGEPPAVGPHLRARAGAAAVWQRGGGPGKGAAGAGVGAGGDGACVSQSARPLLSPSPHRPQNPYFPHTPFEGPSCRNHPLPHCFTPPICPPALSSFHRLLPCVHSLCTAPPKRPSGRAALICIASPLITPPLFPPFPAPLAPPPPSPPSHILPNPSLPLSL